MLNIQELRLSESSDQRKKEPSALTRALASEWPILAGTVAWVVFVLWALSRPGENTSLDAGLQVGALVLSVYASYRFGSRQAAESGAERIRPHARSAFRRVLTIYGGIGRVVRAAQREREHLTGLADGAGKVRLLDADNSLRLLEAIAAEQARTADDALSDWRDIVPDEVAKVEAHVAQQVEDPEPGRELPHGE